MTKPTIIHSKKLFGGRETAENVWRRTVLKGKTCDGCSAPAIIRAVTYAPLDELMKREGIGYLQYLARQAGDPTGTQIPLIKLSHRKEDEAGEKHVKLGTQHACERCQPAFERAMAKGPSWVLHHFDRGPGKDKALVSVK